MEQVTPKPDQVRRDIAIQFTQKNRSMDYAPCEYIQGRVYRGGREGNCPPPPLSFYLYENLFENYKK